MWWSLHWQEANHVTPSADRHREAYVIWQLAGDRTTRPVTRWQNSKIRDRTNRTVTRRQNSYSFWQNRMRCYVFKVPHILFRVDRTVLSETVPRKQLYSSSFHSNSSHSNSFHSKSSHSNSSHRIIVLTVTIQGKKLYRNNSTVTVSTVLHFSQLQFHSNSYTVTVLTATVLTATVLKVTVTYSVAIYFLFSAAITALPLLLLASITVSSFSKERAKWYY